MATPKQTRAAMKKIYYHRRKLYQAIWDARKMNIIDYNADTEKDKNPFVSLWQLESRIDETTTEALANAMRVEIMKGMKW